MDNKTSIMQPHATNYNYTLTEPVDCTIEGLTGKGYKQSTIIYQSSKDLKKTTGGTIVGKVHTDGIYKGSYINCGIVNSIIDEHSVIVESFVTNSIVINSYIEGYKKLSNIYDGIEEEYNYEGGIYGCPIIRNSHIKTESPKNIQIYTSTIMDSELKNVGSDSCRVMGSKLLIEDSTTNNLMYNSHYEDSIITVSGWISNFYNCRGQQHTKEIK